MVEAGAIGTEEARAVHHRTGGARESQRREMSSSVPCPQALLSESPAPTLDRGGEVRSIESGWTRDSVLCDVMGNVADVYNRGEFTTRVSVWRRSFLPACP